MIAGIGTPVPGVTTALQLGTPEALGALFVGLIIAAAVAAESQEPRWGFPPAFLYLLMGVIGAVLIHAFGVSWDDPVRHPLVLERLAQFVLVVALFGSGLRFRTRPPGRQLTTVWLLLAVGMPAAIAVAAVFAHWAMGLPAGAAIVLAGAVAPTDPVMAGEIGVRSLEEPEDETQPAHVVISVEAGMNDGLASPFVLLGMLVAGGGTGWIPGWVGLSLVYGIVVGAVVGILGGRLLAMLVLRSHDRGIFPVEFETFAALAAALLIYGAAQALGGLGLLASFVGGLAFRRFEGDHEYHRAVHRGAVRIERLLLVAVMVAVGSMLTLRALGTPGLTGWALAIVLIVAIRPLTTLPLLARDRDLTVRARTFVAWFGVRGVAAIYYAANIVSEHVLHTADAAKVFWTIIAAVILSIFVHGVTARPLSSLAGR